MTVSHVAVQGRFCGVGSLLLLVCGLQEPTGAVRLPCQRLLAAESSWGSAILRREMPITPVPMFLKPLCACIPHGEHG